MLKDRWKNLRHPNAPATLTLLNEAIEQGRAAVELTVDISASAGEPHKTGGIRKVIGAVLYDSKNIIWINTASTNGGHWGFFLDPQGNIWYPAETKNCGALLDLWHHDAAPNTTGGQMSVDNVKMGGGVGRLDRNESTGHIEIDGMNLTNAIQALVKLAEQDEKKVAINHEFADFFVTEGMVAFAQAMKAKYGRFFAEGTRTTFGEIPPTMVSVEVGPDETLQVIWGKFSIPGMEGSELQSSLGWRQLSNGQQSPIFVLTGVVKQKYKNEIDELAAEIRRIGKASSIYKGKALELRFPNIEETENPMDFAPKFMRVGGLEAPVFDEDTQSVIDNYIYEDIEATELIKANGMNIKKGILMEGPPGVGKTLLAHTIAEKCSRFGWTFCYLKDPKLIASAVALVQRTGWGPAFVFAEDVDRVVGMERTDAVNEVLNVIDGIDGKQSDIAVLFTTNEIDVIHKTMLRPGRLDVLISVHAPDAATVERLIRREAGMALDYEEDLTEVGKELAGTMPAVVVQVVSRAKRAAQRRNRMQGDTRPLSSFAGCITASDLIVAARSMRNHIERLKPVASDERTPIEKAAGIIADSFKGIADSQIAAYTYAKELGNGYSNTNLLETGPKGRRALGAASVTGAKKTETE